MKSSQKLIKINSFEAKQAIGILAVDDIKISNAGLALLKSREEGRITYKAAVSEVVARAKKYGKG